MALTYAQLITMCQRRTKTETDTDALIGFQADLNTAIEIISRKRTWPELLAELPLTINVSTTAPDGVAYALDSSVDLVEQIRITGPTTGYAQILDYVPKKDIRKISPVPTIDGTGTPYTWYFDEPTLSAGVEKKMVNFWPLPDRAYSLMYSYKIYCPVMVATTDVPFFHPKFHEILVDYAIWKYCERDPDPTLNPAYYQAQWLQGVSDLESFFVTEVQDMAQIMGPDRYLAD